MTSQTLNSVTLLERLATGCVKVGVIGLGAVGTVTAELIRSAGLRVAGYDRDQKRVAEVCAIPGLAGCGFGTDPAHLADVDVLVLAVRVPVGADGDVDLEALRAALSTVRALPPKERLVLIETTLPPGTTRRLADEYFKDSDAAGILIAHCPERLRVGDGPNELRDVPRLVSGVTAAATSAACRFLERIGIRPVPVSQPEVAELSKLLENAFLTTGIVLMAEITRIAHALGVEAREVATAAQTKPHGYFAFMPGAGIGGHCLLNDLRLLQGSAQALGVGSELLTEIGRSASLMPATTITRMEALLRTRGQALSGAHVWVIGVGFKPGCADLTGTPAIEVVRQLRMNGAKVVYSDSQVASFAVDGVLEPCVAAGVIPAGIDVALLLSGDRTIDLSSLDVCVHVVLDAGGAQVMMGRCVNMVHL